MIRSAAGISFAIKYSSWNLFLVSYYKPFAEAAIFKFTKAGTGRKSWQYFLLLVKCSLLLRHI
jgi:hypothetical protein